MKPTPGTFCWFEVGTTDQAAAKKFYTDVFDWETEDRPMGPDAFYTLFRLGGNDVAGGYQLGPEMKGVPPHWMIYVAVENADAAAAKAKELGATVMMEPFDVWEIGRMAVLKDPTGAAFSLWQAKSHDGAVAKGKGTFCWCDLNTPDAAKAREFYSKLFGWSYDPGKGGGYQHISNSATPDKAHMIGGIPDEFQAPPGTPAHWLAYVETADCQAAAAKALAAGATAIMPATPMEGVGTIAVLADPQGAVFALYQCPLGDTSGS